MATRIGEAGSANSPWPVHRAVEQRHSLRSQLRADSIHIIDVDGELKTRPGLGTGDSSGLDKLAGRRNVNHVNTRVSEVEYRGVLVFKVQRQAKDILVKQLRALQILDEQGNNIDILQPCAHLRTSFHSLGYSHPVTPTTATRAVPTRHPRPRSRN